MPASNCSCIERHLRSRPARRSERTAWPSWRLRLEDVDEDGVADGQLRLALGVAAVELAVADDALGLRADVDEDLVLVDPDDGALDDVTVLEALDVRVLLGEELLHRRRLGAEVAASGPGLGLFVLVGRGGRVGGLGRVRRRLRCAARPRRPARLGGRASARRCRLGLAAAAGASAAAGSADGASAAAGASARQPGSATASASAGGLGGLGAPSRPRPRSPRRCDGFGRPAPRRWSWCPPCGRVVGGRSGGGLVGDGNRRDGLLGRRLASRGDRLRRRRGPALLLFGQGDRHLLFDGSSPESRQRPGHTPGPGPETTRWWIVGDWPAVRSFALTKLAWTLFSCLSGAGRV